MLPINKQQTPAGLVEYNSRYRHDLNYGYGDFKKDEPNGVDENGKAYSYAYQYKYTLLKQALLNEQHYLCAYCMQRISFDSMTIEHWACQDNYPSLQLDYKNLLAVCAGKCGKDKHCDKQKDNQDICFNPANSQHHCQLKIGYRTKNGKIFSEHEEFNKQLNETLNLNLLLLMNNRKACLDAEVEALNKKKSSNKWPKEFLQEQLVKYQSSSIPYKGIIIWFLEKRLQRP